MTTANHQHPAKLFRLPYSTEFYVCTCDAKTQDACTCDQDALVSTHRNPYLADPVLVDWLLLQNEPFSISQAIEAVGLADEQRIQAAIRVTRELRLCGCERIDSGIFKPASADTLAGLLLRQPAGKPANSVNAQRLDQALSASWQQEIEEMRRLTQAGGPFAPPLSASFLKFCPANRSDQTQAPTSVPLQATDEAPDPLL